MPPARALVDAGAAVALATDFNPGSAFCESLPLVCSLAATQLQLSPAEALAACTVNAAHVLGRADRIGRLAPGYRADVTLLDAPDWRYLAYHLGGRVVARVVVGGELALSPPCRRGSSGAARRRNAGTSTRPSGSTPRATSSRSRPRRSCGSATRGDGAKPQANAKPKAPATARRSRGSASLRRRRGSARRSRSLILGAVVFVLFFLLGAKNGGHNLAIRAPVSR